MPRHILDTFRPPPPPVGTPLAFSLQEVLADQGDPTRRTIDTSSLYEPQAELRAAPAPSLADYAIQKMQALFMGGGMDKYSAGKLSKQIVGNEQYIGLMDVAPGTWWWKAFDRAGKALRGENYGEAAIHAAAGALGPAGRPIVKFTGDVARRIAPGMFKPYPPWSRMERATGTQDLNLTPSSSEIVEAAPRISSSPLSSSEIVGAAPVPPKPPALPPPRISFSPLRKRPPPELPVTVPDVLPFKVPAYVQPWDQGKLETFLSGYGPPAPSRAEQLPDSPVLVFDVRNEGGSEGVFPNEQAAKDYIARSGNKFLDYGTPREIERFNPTGPESYEHEMQAIERLVREAGVSNENVAAAPIALPDQSDTTTFWTGGPDKWQPEPGYPHGRPRIDKIGEGEGAAMYGPGSYAGQAVDTAKTYQPREHDLEAQYMAKYKAAETRHDTATMEVMERYMLHESPADISKFINSGEYEPAYVEEMMRAQREGAAIYRNAETALMRQDVPNADLAKYLDWDAPLSEQTGEVRAALERGGFINAGKLSQSTEPNGRIIFRDDKGSIVATAIPESMMETGEGRSGYRLSSIGENATGTRLSRPAVDDEQMKRVVDKWWSGDDITGEQLMHRLGRAQPAADALREAGIPGNKYLDQGSRGTGQGTRNIVTWDQDTLDRFGVWAEGYRPKVLRRDASGKPIERAPLPPPAVGDALLEEMGLRLDEMGPIERSLAAPKPTETPAFKEWFGGSKMVDEAGDPLTLYHGTRDDVEYFNLDHPGRKDVGWLGEGVYLTTDPQLSGMYSQLKRGAADPNVMPVYGKLENPYYATLDEKHRIQMITMSQGEEAGRAAAGEWTRALQAKGHDGVVLQYRPEDVGAANASREVVVFDPKGVKSAIGNVGTYNPDSDSLTDQPLGRGPLVQSLVEPLTGKTPPPAPLSPIRQTRRINQMAFDNDARDLARREGITFDQATQRMEAEAEAVVTRPPEVPNALTLSNSERASSLGDVNYNPLHVRPAARRKVEDIARDVNAKTLEATGGELRDDASIAKIIANEAWQALKQTNNAATWYGDKIRGAHHIGALKFPELLTDPIASSKLNFIMAIMSNGTKVSENAKLAWDGYDEYKRTGLMPAKGSGKELAAQEFAFRLWDRLAVEMGEADLIKFLTTKYTVRDINAMGLGKQVSGELQDELVYGGAIFGPKVGGAFLPNLEGFMDSLTMDRWAMRTIGRVRGDLVTAPNPALHEKRIKRLLGTLTEANVGRFGYTLKQVRGKDNQAALEEMSAKALAAYQKSGFKKRTKFNMAAQRVSEDKSLLAQPRSGADRRSIRAIFAEVVKLLDQAGVKTTLADTQATVWYPEQEFYGRLGAPNKSQVDFESVFKDLALTRGFTEDQVNAAISRSRGR